MLDDAVDAPALWARIESALRRRRAVEPRSVARVMSAVRAQRMEPVAPPTKVAAAARWLTRRHVIHVSPAQALTASVIAAAALYALWGFPRDPASRDPRDVAPSPVAASIAAESHNGSRLVQFVFVARDARRVTIAGDFNDWNLVATPLQRAGAEGVWSIVLPLSPGRYRYAFVVDGKRWLPDAEAPRAPENEFGAESSVVLVEQGS